MQHNHKVKRPGIIIMIFMLFVTVVSCKKNNIPDAPVVLTAEVKSNLSALADQVFLETSTPGLMALISVEGEPDFLIKRGSANLSTNQPVDENNAFRIASVTKTFTGTAVLLLADEGAIDLDSTITSYLPEYNVPSGNAITVRMLGNMTSGLFDYSQDPDLWVLFTESGYTLYFPPDSLLSIAFRHPMHFPPGTDYEYCNTNTVLLGLLLEKITGKPASQVIKEKVLVPLNLTNTYFGGPFFMYEPYSHGYTLGDEGLIDATNWNPSWGYTAGAMISKLDDLKQWAAYLAEGALLSEAMKAERFDFGTNDYGFCVETMHYKDANWVGHPGIMPGYNTQVWYNQVKKTTVIINSNSEVNLPAQTLLIEFIMLLGDL
jgi:D-alanyl-D-alanine carboxypeptidase